jgi:hypothetical protein
MRHGWTVALILAGSFLIGRTLTWLAAPPAPQVKPTPVIVAPPAPDSERLVHELCDREVDALLHSHDLVEVERAVAIVRDIPCAIERRL